MDTIMDNCYICTYDCSKYKFCYYLLNNNFSKNEIIPIILLICRMSLESISDQLMVLFYK